MSTCFDIKQAEMQSFVSKLLNAEEIAVLWLLKQSIIQRGVKGQSPDSRFQNALSPLMTEQSAESTIPYVR